jgi:dolichyl-phosphate-mannose-protein mannosyltransferase
MSSPSSSLRKRGGKKEDYAAVPSGNASLHPAVAAARKQSEWDYWLAMIVLTVLAFATRFYRIDYPNEVVFDEVHFGKVCISYGELRSDAMATGAPSSTGFR